MASSAKSGQRNYYVVFLIMLTFFVISFLTNIIGPLIPDIIKSFNLSLTMVAVLPFAFFIAYGVFSIPAGILNEKYGEKKIMALAFVVAFTGALLLAQFPNYLTAIFSLFMIGSGMAMLQVVINPLLRTAGGEEHYAFNSVLAQLIFGAASFLSPLVYSYIVLNMKGSVQDPLIGLLSSVVPENLSWISLYWVFAVISILMVIVILLSQFPKVELKQDEKAGAVQVHLNLLKKPVVILYFLGILCYVGTEQGVANWISQFLSEYHNYDPQTSGAKAVAYFWGLMTAGGVLGLVLLKLVDSRKVLIAFTILAIISLTMGLFGSAAISLWTFPVVGFFASVMYPIIFSLSLNSLEKHQGVFAGILLTGVVGGAIVPLIIGSLGDHFGLRTGMFFLYMTLAYILSIGFWARPLINNRTLSRRRKAD